MGRNSQHFDGEEHGNATEVYNSGSSRLLVWVDISSRLVVLALHQELLRQ